MPIPSHQIPSLYAHYAKASRRRLPFQTFSRILESPDTEPISSIKQRVRASGQAVKRVLVFSGARTPEKIIEQGIAANGRSRRLETILEPATVDWVTSKLRGRKMTLGEIAAKSGISFAGVKSMNNRIHGRKNTKSVGQKIAKARVRKDAWDAVAKLLSARTPEGKFKYTETEIPGRLADQHIFVGLETVTRIAKKIRSLQERRSFEGKRIPNAARREEFLRKAFKLTFEPRDRIAQRALERESRHGYSTTINAIRQSATKVRVAHGITGRRFQESKKAKKRIIRVFMPKKTPMSFNWRKMAKQLRIPLKFIRDTIAEEFLRRGYHPTRVTEITGIAESRLYQMRDVIKQKQSA